MNFPLRRGGEIKILLYPPGSEPVPDCDPGSGAGSLEKAERHHLPLSLTKEAGGIFQVHRPG